MLVDENGPMGLTLRRSIYCELDAGLAFSAAAPAPARVIVRTEGATRSLRTERKAQVDVEHQASGVSVGRAQAGESADRPAAETRPTAERAEAAAVAVADGQAAARAAIEVEDDEIVRRCVTGDRDAFEQLVRRHSPRVFNIIASFFRRRDIVEDIAQDVFVKSYVSLSSYTLGRSFEAWLARITVNSCYDHLRAERRRGEQFFPQDPDREGDWLDLQMLETAIGRHASDERRREAADISDRLLSKLAPEDRLVLVLMDRDGFSVKDISEITGWGPSKVKVRAFRARRSLRAAMKRLMTSAERMQRRVR
jgi:RNA polymerase sigma-70 factor (ECF subfamily)